MKPETGNSGKAGNTGTPGAVNRPQLTNQQRPHQRPPLLECKTCGKRHSGVCNQLSGTCFKCNKGHFVKDCKVGIVCNRCGKPGHISKECKAPVPANMMMQAIEAPPAAEPIAPARVQNLTMREAVRDTDIIVGTLLVNSTHAKVLIDSGASKSFISEVFANKLKCPIEPLNKVLNVEIANQERIPVSQQCPRCVIEIAGRQFYVDLIPF